MLRDEAAWMANRKEVRFLDKRSDGFIFVSPGVGEWTSTLEALVENKIPCVVCYHRDVPSGVVWVDPDNEGIIDLMLERLLVVGHKRIVYLAGPITVTSEQPRLVLYGGERAYDDRERERFFRERTAALCAAGVEGIVASGVDKNYDVTDEVLDGILASGATAVLCGDHVALQLWTLAERRGLSVPTDLSLIGIDDTPLGAMRGLTSVRFRYSDVGAAAVDAWIDVKNGISPSEASRKVGVGLSDRASVAAPRKSLG
jgi:DNA-binding LacI/PurR family transcriptional regulator